MPGFLKLHVELNLVLYLMYVIMRELFEDMCSVGEGCMSLSGPIAGLGIGECIHQRTSNLASCFDNVRGEASRNQGSQTPEEKTPWHVLAAWPIYFDFLYIRDPP